MNGAAWSGPELKVLRALYPLGPTRELAEILGRSVSATNGAAAKLGLKKSRGYLDSDWYAGKLKKGSDVGKQFRFAEGHVPANKGLRRPGWYAGRMRETQFKRGCRLGMAAKNWRPVGTILPDPYGYLRIKVREAVHGERTGYGNVQVWPMLARVVWEREKGPIPAGKVIVFINGDRANCGIENLELISRAELARRNRMWGRFPRELAEAIQLNGALKRKMRTMSNGKE